VDDTYTTGSISRAVFLSIWMQAMHEFEEEEMTDKQRQTSRDEPAKTWRYFVSHISRWPGTEERGGLRRNDVRKTEESGVNLVNSVIAVLSPRAASGSQAHDLDIMRRLVSSVQEAATEGIITKKEADAVAGFLVAKFVERRFSGILLNTFDLESSRRCAFRRIAGKAEHGRQEEATR
jgi:hypothetical protein